MLLQYFAITPEGRGSGLGSAFLQLLHAEYPEKTWVLEVEDPDAARDMEDRATREKRVRFYQKQGYVMLEHVRYTLFGVSMRIMLRGDAPADIREMMHAFYRPMMPYARMLKYIHIE